jgi:hypothetical protein
VVLLSLSPFYELGTTFGCIKTFQPWRRKLPTLKVVSLSLSPFYELGIALGYIKIFQPSKLLQDICWDTMMKLVYDLNGNTMMSLLFYLDIPSSS